jgi:hypothetical protein
VILLDIPARVVCDEPGCPNKSPVQLCLTVGGTLAFKPPATSRWQVGAAKNGTFVTLCHEHAKLIEPAPLIQTIGTRSEH